MNQYKTYVTGLAGSKKVHYWVETTLASRLKKYQDPTTDVEHILDYLCSPDGPNKLQYMSYPQALVKAQAWSKAQQKKGNHIKETEKDLRLVHDFLNGTRIVQLLTKAAVQREGFLMRHCVGGYDPTVSTIYSYRDKKNKPHATFEVSRNGNEILQIKGKGNGDIHPRYIHQILAFLKLLGINVRPPDMINLGYKYIDKAYLAHIRELYPEDKIESIILFNEEYIT